MVKNEHMPSQGRFSRQVSRYVAGMLREREVKQRVIAGRLGRTQAYVSERVNGHRSWTLDELDVISSLLDFTSGLSMLEEIAARARLAQQRTDVLARRREARGVSEVSDSVPRAALGHDPAAEFEEHQQEP